MEFRDIKELVTLMNDGQKSEAKAAFDKFYSAPFANSREILCSSTEDGENFLSEVDLNSFE